MAPRGSSHAGAVGLRLRGYHGLVSAGPDVVARELVSVDPATLDAVGRVPITTPEELSEVVVEARMAQIAFAREPLEARSRLLEGVSHALVEDDRRIAETIVAESGKPLAEAYVHDLIVAADACSWLAANLGRVLRDETLPFPQLVLRHKHGAIRYAPLGVVAVVSPWNFPLALPLRHAAAAVAAGNAVVLKPSELTPMCGALVEELFRRAGAPPGLVRVVQGPGESIGDALVRHRGIDGVVFTGSTEVGRLVAQAAAERLCPAVLELGGKDPMLVLDDADLDRAVEGALWGAFANCGQACAGIERIAVPPGLHDEFVERLTRGAEALRHRPRLRSGASSSDRLSPRSSGRASRIWSPTRSSTVQPSLPAVGALGRSCRAGSTSRRSCSASPGTRDCVPRSCSVPRSPLSNSTTTRR